jgi:hypothetical protein
MRRLFLMGLVPLGVVVIIGSAGCGNEQATEAVAAIKAGNDALAAVKRELEPYVPDQYKALSDRVAAAGALYEKGDYAAALAAARELPAKANELRGGAAKKKQELAASFDAMKDLVPGRLEALKLRVHALASMKRLPRGIDTGQVAAIQAQLDAMIGLWAKATQAFDAGNVLLAFGAGDNVKEQAGALSSRLDLVSAPPAGR